MANFTGKQLSFSFELFSVISKISFADFEHVFVCLERYRKTIAVVQIIKYLTKQTNIYSNLVTETLKQDVNSVKC